MILPLKNTALQVHPLFPGLLLFGFFTGRSSILFSVLALLLHECGHLLALRLFHVRPKHLSLTPFGGLIDLPENHSLSPFGAFVTAAAGPAASLLGCIISLAAVQKQWLSFPSSFAFLRANALLLAVNLLPALPLDGGRMLQAILSRFFQRSSVSRCLLIAGNIAALSLIGLSVYSAVQGEYTFAPAFAGSYILYGCGMEHKKSPYHYYSNLIGRRVRPSAHPLPVQHLAVSGAMALKDMLPQLKSNCYHLFQVLEKDGMDISGQLDDAAFCRLLMDDESLTFSQALQCMKKQRS